MATAALTTSTNRRRFLAAGSAASVFATLGATVAAESALSGLIASHTRLRAELNECCGWWDKCEPEFDAAKAGLQQPMFAAEDAALDDLCAYPCKTMAEAQAKARYLDHNLLKFELQDHHIASLIGSFLS